MSNDHTLGRQSDHPTHAPSAAVDRVRLDETFDALSNRRRRDVLYYLHQANGETVDVCDVADTMTAWEVECLDDVEPDHFRSLLVSLRHVHLPKLDDIGAVSYDRDRDTVEQSDSPVIHDWVDLAAVEELT
ncbi:DUF7344 domain-containing protein [Haloprofundus salinisoli]|uniref:DUF7344 domain-containing protein n=1 Tax=Haloprofundus salinisoli TaxID=2876193 RepID=UPI001CCEB5B9|nr:hypothetical protein [Haloprofundus salinisoli]